MCNHSHTTPSAHSCTHIPSSSSHYTLYTLSGSRCNFILQQTEDAIDCKVHCSIWSFCLKGREKEIQREMIYLSGHFAPGLGQAEVRRPECNLDLPCGWQRPKELGHHLLLAGMFSNRKLESGAARTPTQALHYDTWTSQHLKYSPKGIHTILSMFYVLISLGPIALIRCHKR